jgi:geranylgeranyl diphosphate/geranylgeranyl-bacteriochlorophyllide a reductase
MSKQKVIVIGGGPGGATAGRILAQNGVDSIVFERSFTRPKPCGGAIPPLVMEEFAVKPEIIDCHVKTAAFFSPTNRSTDIEVRGTEPTANDWVGMVKRDKFDQYLRVEAMEAGADVIEAKVNNIEFLDKGVRVTYVQKGVEKKVEADAIIGADGAYSMVAKAVGAPRVPQAVAMHYRIALPEPLMEMWRTRAELYLGDDVSPDFYGWVFPKYDHVSVGVGAGPEKSNQVRQYLENLVKRAGSKIAGGTLIATEAHALPMQPQKQIAFNRAMLIGDAAGMVVHTSGEGIYWAMKSGKMAAETLLKNLDAPTAANLMAYQKQWKKQYGTMYGFLTRLEQVYFGRNNKFEVFTEMCRDNDVQRLTFDSYLHKKMAKLPVTSGLKIFGKMWFNFARFSLPVPGIKPKALPQN